MLEPVLTGALGLSSTAARDGWETFEYLAYAVAGDRLERHEPAHLVRPLTTSSAGKPHQGRTKKHRDLTRRALHGE